MALPGSDLDYSDKVPFWGKIFNPKESPDVTNFPLQASVAPKISPKNRLKAEDCLRQLTRALRKRTTCFDISVV